MCDKLAVNEGIAADQANWHISRRANVANSTASCRTPNVIDNVRVTAAKVMMRQVMMVMKM